MSKIAGLPAAQYHRAWRAANKVQINAYKRAWRAANKVQINAYKRAWRAANKHALKVAACLGVSLARARALAQRAAAPP